MARLRPVLALARRDLVGTFASAFGVGCAAGLVALSGVLLVLDLRGDQAVLDQWFGPLFLVVALLSSLLTVRSFAEEERTGSLELVLTAPLRPWQVVAGKYLGMVGAMLVCLAVTVVCPAFVAVTADPDPGPILTGYVGLVLASLAFVGVGVAVSAATSSFLASAAGSTAILAALWFGGLLAGNLTGRTGFLLAYLSPSSHITGFLRGTISASAVAYFLSFALVGTATAVAVLEARR
jgi:ABC-2 type transport system permease protein